MKNYINSDKNYCLKIAYTMAHCSMLGRMRFIKKNKMKVSKYIMIALLLVTVISCGSMEKSDRMVRRKDFLNRFSQKEIVAISGWKMGVDKLLLRKNKTFRIYSNVFGIVNSGYYSGNYEISNDTLKLNYLNNHKLAFDKLYFSTENNQEVLKCKEKTFYIERNLLNKKKTQ